MQDVGGVACDLVKGFAQKLKTRANTWTVDGIDGYGIQTLGKCDARFLFTAAKYGQEADVETWGRSIEDLQGTTITVVDDFGRTHQNLFVERVSEPRKMPALKPGTNPLQDTRGEITLEGVVTEEASP